MRKILQIVGGLNRGGLESFVMNMYRAIDRSRYQFDFLLIQLPGGDYAEEAKSLGANIFTLPPRNKGYKAYRNALHSFFIEHHDYIAVHQHISSLTAIEPLFYAKKYGISVRVLHSHNSAIDKRLRFHKLHLLLHYMNKYKVHSYATHYLGCSDMALDWLFKYTGVRSKAQMVNNGIDAQLYSYNEKVRQSARREFKFNDNEFVIGHVGRFSPVKNHTFLIDIFCKIKEKRDHVKLLLIGEGPLLEQMAAEAKSKGVADYVVFAGVRSDVHRLMQAMDSFVMPSLFEGLPVTLVEAQAAGLPIVASDTISKNSDITDTILFKSLSDGDEKWADAVLENAGEFKRYNNLEKIKNAGFDSITTANLLLSIYNEK